MEDVSDIGLKQDLQLKKKRQNGGLSQMILSEFVTIVLCWKKNLKH